MITFTKLVNDIYLGQSPYDDFAPLPPKYWTAWGSDHPWLTDIVQKLKPQCIIETGSYYGGSAINFGQQVCKWLGCVICVDTWLAEHVLWTIPEHRERLLMRNGRPQFYEQFLSNVIDAKLTDTILPISMTSLSGARLLQKFNVTAKVIYIDACHETPDVYNDLTLYWDLLEPGGAMLIDDYSPGFPMFSGVVHDVDRFVKERNLLPSVNGNKALIYK